MAWRSTFFVKIENKYDIYRWENEPTTSEFLLIVAYQVTATKGPEYQSFGFSCFFREEMSHQASSWKVHLTDGGPSAW